MEGCVYQQGLALKTLNRVLKVPCKNPGLESKRPGRPRLAYTSSTHLNKKFHDFWKEL